MMSTATKLLTAEEFWLLPDTENRRSLIRGEVVETMPPGGEHGIIAIAFGGALRLWAKANRAGVVGGESGFLLARHPDIVRAPDIYFVRAERIPEGGVPKAFWDIAPDLAVEVISPSESAQDILDKVQEYLAAGTSLVWVAYPHAVTVVAHTPDGLARTFRSHDLLADPDVLPGFSCTVRDLFE
jgi:Uma2 family endonuclease